LRSLKEMTSEKTRRVLKTVLAWGLALVMAYGYLLSALPLLTTNSVWIGRFESWGYGESFMIFIGVLELLGGLLLLIPRTVLYGVVILLPIMIGATYTHLSTDIGSPFHALRAIVVLLILVCLRWPDYLKFGKEDRTPKVPFGVSREL